LIRRMNLTTRKEDSYQAEMVQSAPECLILHTAISFHTDPS
jgi:hypothetical protein